MKFTICHRGTLPSANGQNGVGDRQQTVKTVWTAIGKR